MTNYKKIQSFLNCDAICSSIIAYYTVPESSSTTAKGSAFEYTNHTAAYSKASSETLSIIDYNTFTTYVDISIKAGRGSMSENIAKQLNKTISKKQLNKKN